MTQIIKKKKWLASSGEEKLFRTIFFRSVNLRNAKILREESWRDELVNLSENIPTSTETVTQGSSIHLLGMSSHIQIHI